MPTLKETYQQRAVPALREKLGLANAMQVPRLTKVVINMGIGVVDKDTLKAHVNELTALAGQKPLITKSRKSISNFKLREGMNIGAKVTLRGARMFDFLERLIQAALPRIRDFRGVSPRGFDGRGNYTLGLKEQTLFPEVDPNAVTAPQGMDITIVTTAKTDDQARELLRQLGMPFAAK